MKKTDYTLSKTIFTEMDMEELCFHDCPIYAMAPVGNDLVMDIDYMFEWLEPKGREKGFTYPISPCTIYFKNVEDFGMSFEGSYPETALIMQDFAEDDNKFFPEQHIYNIGCLGGNFVLRCDGFELIVRQKPVLTKRQGLTMKQRGGISFSRKPYKRIKTTAMN